jgi:GT2 family glycosyltransferase
MVSVIIPAYKQAQYTFSCLESLASCETTLPFEVVVVDNASNDETNQVLARMENLVVQRNERNLGFGEACNQGAVVARGEYVCFLNNDTLVTPGLLTILVDTIRRNPEWGAVGAKLIHANGKLQEAGSVLWADGSGIGYGRGQDPAGAEFEYLREVDYCSAACLLMSRSLFRTLGGFDVRYLPAYYEDADLCMSVREAGYRVIFQPRASVIHMEFGSSDPERAVDLQLRNRDKFIAKWRHRVRFLPATSSQELLLSRDRRPGKRLLMADDRVPEASMGSGFPRARAMLDALASLGYVVTFLPLADPAPHEPATGQLQQDGVEILHSQTDLRSCLEERRGLYDAAIFSRPHNAKWMKEFKAINPTTAILYDAEALYTIRDALQADVNGRPLAAAEVSRKMSEEIDMMAPADVVLTVSDSERRAVHRNDPKIPVCVWGHSVAARTDPPGFDPRHNFLFVGCLSTPPNADALTVLLRDLFPEIRSRTNACLLVAGANPPPSAYQSYADLQGVLLTGFVPDLTPLYDQSRVFVAPHRFAAGAPLKVIEAMAAGLPCVVSKLLGDQLELTDGVDALVARNAADFREKSTRLYEDRDLWVRVQKGSLRMIRERFDARQMRTRLGECIEEALIRRAGGTLPAHPVTEVGGMYPDTAGPSHVAVSQFNARVGKPVPSSRLDSDD